MTLASSRFHVPSCQSASVSTSTSKPNPRPQRLRRAAMAGARQSVRSGTSSSRSTSLSSLASPRACDPNRSTSRKEGTAARIRAAINARIDGAIVTGCLRSTASTGRSTAQPLRNPLSHVHLSPATAKPPPSQRTAPDESSPPGHRVRFPRLQQRPPHAQR